MNTRSSSAGYITSAQYTLSLEGSPAEPKRSERRYNRTSWRATTLLELLMPTGDLKYRSWIRRLAVCPLGSMRVGTSVSLPTRRLIC
jgi:hypothetical protein